MRNLSPVTPSASNVRRNGRPPCRAWQVLVNWVFFQVSIAVLLDNFLSASELMKAEEHRKKIKGRQARSLASDSHLSYCLLAAKNRDSQEASLSHCHSNTTETLRPAARAVMFPLLCCRIFWTSIQQLTLCVRACVRACAGAGARARACVCVRVCRLN